MARVGWAHLKRLCKDKHTERSSRAVRGLSRPPPPTRGLLAAIGLLRGLLGQAALGIDGLEKGSSAQSHWEHQSAGG